jgi:hypothetical protein
MNEFAFPAARAQQLGIHLVKRCGERRPQKLVSDLADGL